MNEQLGTANVEVEECFEWVKSTEKMIRRFSKG